MANAEIRPQTHQPTNTLLLASTLMYMHPHAATRGNIHNGKRKRALEHKQACLLLYLQQWLRSEVTTFHTVVGRSPV